MDQCRKISQLSLKDEARFESNEPGSTHSAAQYVPTTQRDDAREQSDEDPPPYEDVPELRQALRIIGHVRECSYITTGEGGCAKGCRFLGTTLLLRPWQLEVKSPGTPATYVQLQLAHRE